MILLSEGVSLAFVAYPSALSQMPWANLLLIIFFLTVDCLALSSIAAGVHNSFDFVINEFGLEDLPNWKKRVSVTSVVEFNISSRRRRKIPSGR